jgi:hypothetical protein
MKKNILALLLLMAIGPCFSQSIYNVDCRKIKIYTTDKAAKFIPTQWKGKPIGAKCKELQPPLQEQSISIIIKELNKYPKKLLKKNLKKILIFDSLSFFNKAYGGTYNNKYIFMTNHFYSDQDLAMIFHHEFSSILLKRNLKDFNLNGWKNTLPTIFEYKSKGLDALGTKDASYEFNDSLNTLGFLNAYSLYNFEEDFNSFAQYLWSGDKIFWAKVDQYPALKRKLNLLIQFYQNLDPCLNEGFFRKITN